MANSWNIPDWLEIEVRARDKHCVYCGVEFTPTKISKRTAASWEHIINDAKIITRKIFVYAAVAATLARAKSNYLNGSSQNIANNKALHPKQLPQ